MIVGLLFVVSLFIAISDFSNRWLDSETQNILYYDTDVGVAASGDVQAENKSADSGAVKPATPEVTSDAVQQDLNSNSMQGDATVVSPSSKSGKDLEEDILSMLQENIASSSSSDVVELDDLDDDSEDEVPAMSKPMSHEEVMRDANNIFEKFSNRHL